MAEVIGPKMILLMVVLISSIINLLTPLLADWHVSALFVSRIIMGISQVRRIFYYLFLSLSVLEDGTLIVSHPGFRQPPHYRLA